MPLSNRAPVNAAGQIMVTGTTPTPAWPVLGGITYDPVTGELAVTSAVPNATDPWVGGIRFTNLGAMYVTSTLPSPLFYVGGLPVSKDGRLFMSAGPPVGSVGGWPVGGDGGVSGIGLSPQPIFDAPLTSTLVPTTAGNPAFTFTRATTAYVSGVAPGGNAVDGEVLILCDANEARFAGARRVSSGVWSALYADGSAIPAAKLLGFVAENAATNLCLQSQTFDNAAWTADNCAIAANDATVAAPDGTLTADKFTDNATNSFHRIYQSLNFTAAPYTFSIYAKAGTLSWLRVFPSTVAPAAWVNFNIATGVIGSQGGAAISATITPLPNGWFRCSLTLTGIATAALIQLESSPNGTNGPNSTYVGTGQTMYLWGAQVETGSDPSSYIATTTAAVVRNGDNLTYPWVSNIDGALATTYAETYSLSTTTPRIIVANLATARYPQYFSSNLLSFYSNAAGMSVVNASTVGAINKNASAWSGATASLCANGGAVATAAFSAFANVGNVGVGGDGATNLKGSIRNVKFYNVRIADADLITMTA